MQTVARLLIIAKRQLLLTLVLIAFSGQAFAATDLGKQIPITAPSWRDYLDYIFLQHRTYLKGIKERSDVRREGSRLYLDPPTISGCEYNKAVLEAKSSKTGDLVSDSLILFICGQQVGSINLKRQGAQTQVMSASDILDGNWPLPNPEETWSLSSSWSEDYIKIYCQRNYSQANFFALGILRYRLDESSQPDRVVRSYQLNYRDEVDLAPFVLTAQISKVKPSFFSTVKYQFNGNPISPDTFSADFAGNFDQILRLMSLSLLVFTDSQGSSVNF